MRRLAVAGAIVAAVSVLLACSAPEEPVAEVTVSGKPGERPIATYVTPLTVTDPSSWAVWPGTGERLTDGGPVLLDYWIENATDASLVRESYSTGPAPRLLTAEELGADLYATLHGQRVGARLVQLSPADAEGGTPYPTVTVLDVLPTRADGDEVPPREGLPAVRRSDSGEPSIAASKEDPPAELVAQPLVRGSGRQVADGDTITVQYTGFSWKTGEPFDSTWSVGLPVSFSLDEVPAWSEGLVDQTIGSQVLLVVPPTYRLGVTDSQELKGQTVVFVVDILDSRSPDPDQEPTP